MITKVFAIYDSKANAFANPFYMQSNGEAVRAFTDLVADDRTMVNKHPSDFVLYQVGTWDDNSGVLTAIHPHVHLGLAADYKQIKPRFSEVSDDVGKALVESNGKKK